MPSHAMLTWQLVCESRLEPMRQLCLADVSADRSAALADEQLRAFVVLLSAHFQGFLRDLYTECVQSLVRIMPESLRIGFEFQCFGGLKLETGNPKWDNIRIDFDRIGLDISQPFRTKPESERLLTQLGLLNRARNAVAHRENNRPDGVAIDSEHAAIWFAACDTIARELESVMDLHLATIIGQAPW